MSLKTKKNLEESLISRTIAVMAKKKSHFIPPGTYCWVHISYHSLLIKRNNSAEMDNIHMADNINGRSMI